MKATLFLLKDHERIRELFEKFKRASEGGENGRRAIFQHIRRELELHFSIETALFYPELDAVNSPNAPNLVRSALDDHLKVEVLLDEISSSLEKDVDKKILDLMDLVNDHIDREEEIFAEARGSFSEQRLEELGLEMEDRRRMLTQAAA